MVHIDETLVAVPAEDGETVKPVRVVQHSPGGELFLSQDDEIGFGPDARVFDAIINLTQEQAAALADILKKATGL